MISIDEFIENRLGIVCDTKEKIQAVINEVSKHSDIRIGINPSMWNIYKENTFLIVHYRSLKYGNKNTASEINMYDFDDTEFRRKLKKSNVR